MSLWHTERARVILKPGGESRDQRVRVNLVDSCGMDGQITRIAGGRLAVRFAFDPDAIRALRAIPGRRWDLVGRPWTRSVQWS